jgi:hypothetical protein
MLLDLESPDLEMRSTGRRAAAAVVETFRVLSDEGGGTSGFVKTSDGDQVIYDNTGE